MNALVGSTTGKANFTLEWTTLSTINNKITLLKETVKCILDENSVNIIIIKHSYEYMNKSKLAVSS